MMAARVDRTATNLLVPVLLFLGLCAASSSESAEPTRESRARRQLPATAPPETTWVGHVRNPTGLPGTAGGHGPFHLGRGSSRPGVDPNGLWDWDSYQSASEDSLMGWWPIRRAYNITGGISLSDRNRPWWALDHGNQANYVSNLANRRTFGVIGAWHRDRGTLQPAPGGLPTPAWTPPFGSYAAWMGLRAHGDNTFTDPQTGNPFNEDCLMFNGENAVSSGGNDKGFPGYGSQMDQMLYRDIDAAGMPFNAGLTIRFWYQTTLSTAFDTAAATRTGWFDGDPVGSVSGTSNPQPNNFISSTDAGAWAPRDSFMVYVGMPTDESHWVPAAKNFDPSIAVGRVYDVRRRWFSEVLVWDRDAASPPNNPQPRYYRELLSVAGNHPAGGGSFIQVTAVVPASLVSLFRQSNDYVRLVFRVKTNRGSDDEGAGYSSSRRGAAIVDRVSYQFTGQSEYIIGDFESAFDINNDPNVSAVDAWKSTGKPPAIFHHRDDLSNMRYEDIHGMPGDSTRLCNMLGGIISSGDHDDSGEPAGGRVEGLAERERMDGIISPAISLASNGTKAYNEMGIDAAIAACDEIVLKYEIYAGIYDLAFTGNAWTFGFQSYPGAAKASSGGYPAWGQLRTGPDLVNVDKECRINMEAGYANGLIRTSNSSGIPDSIRVFLGKQQQCFRFGLSIGCSPTDGSYFDNVAVGLVAPPAPCQLTYIWNRGPAISLTEAVQYWPSGSMLRQMRPADVIALKVVASDSDLLEVFCTCDGHDRSVPYGPFQDQIECDWRLLSRGDRGKIVEPQSDEKNVVIYQLPTCGWKVEGVSHTIRDSVEVTVRNATDTVKEEDPPLTGTKILFTMVPCAGDNGLYIRVTIDVIPGSAPPGEVLIPLGDGDCIPAEPTWAADQWFVAPLDIVETAPTVVCPNYLTMLSIDPLIGPIDPDTYTMRCTTSNPQCIPRQETHHALDKLIFTWTLVDPPTGNYFPLGNNGAVLAVQRSRTKNLTVKCTVTNPAGRAVDDPPLEKTYVVAKSTRPKAYVGTGYDKFLVAGKYEIGDKDPFLKGTAAIAKKNYEDLGYQVTLAEDVTPDDVDSILSDPCYQALWLNGHGFNGGLQLADKSSLGGSRLGIISSRAFRCPEYAFEPSQAHPFIRDLVMMACDTFHQNWDRYLLCGRTLTFDYNLRPLLFGTKASPDHLEKHHHNPPRAHNFTAE